MTLVLKLKDRNYWAYDWYEKGLNPIPRDGKIPIIKYKMFKNQRLPQYYFDNWVTNDTFNKNNLCIMIGKLTGHTDTLNFARSGLYLNFADFDNELAIKELCCYKDRQFTLRQFSKVVYVVQHFDDPTHCHVYWLASKPMPKRTIDKDAKILGKIRNNKLPSIEIKGAGDVAFCAGGTHESGYPYLPIGTKEICIIEELGEHIQAICKKYNLPVSDVERNKSRLRRLNNYKLKFKSNPKLRRILSEYADNNIQWRNIYENSRNNTLFDRARRYLRKNRDLLTPDNFKRIVQSWNAKWCKPPLSGFEVNNICNSILSYQGQGQNNDNGDHQENV